MPRPRRGKVEKILRDSALTANLPFAAKRLRERSPTQSRVSTIVRGCKLFSNEAAKKAAAVPKDSFKEYWPYLQTMLRLVRAHHQGEYDQVTHDSLWIVAARTYLDPFDLIPDKTPFLGFIDDAAVVEFVVDRTRQRSTIL